MTTATVCPISLERVDHNTVRVTGGLTIAMLAAFAVTGFAPIAVALAADYSIRAWTRHSSPMQLVARRIARGLGIPVQMKDKAPKQFAARIGFLFALAAALFAILNPVVAVGVGLTLLGFNVLDSVFDFCVGCFCYSNVVVRLQARLQS